MDRVPRWLRVALITLVAVAALVVVGDQVTSSPQLCASCHEIRPRVAEWSQSAHAQVSCVECHVEPHEWYQTPRAIVQRSVLIGRDLYLHLSGDYQDPVEARADDSEPMPDEVCLQCHSADRQATSGYRILIDHVEHAERNGSCVSCHVGTAHPEPERGRALTLMSQCYTCHGTAENPEASAECAACHPADFDLVPQSHEDAKWDRGHGRVAESDRRQCAMCHEQRFCNDCHGLPMPHPAGWDKGRAGHAATAERDREICARCHTEKPDLCSMCHHARFDTTKGSWTEQHNLAVREEGVAYCLTCHEPLSCARCHTKVSMELGQ